MLHRRDSIDSAALLSRSIEIHTSYSEDVRPLNLDNFAEIKEMLDGVASLCDWSQVKASSGSRSRDTWAPPMEFARAIGDEEFLSTIDNQIAKANEELKHGRWFEPKQQIYSLILSLATRDGGIERMVPLRQVAENMRKEPE